MLQTTGRIATDNLVQAGAEIVWAIGAIAGLGFGCRWDWSVGCAYLAASGLLLAARLILVRRSIPASAGRVAIDLAFTSRLLGFGLLVVAAQLADYLYAPTDLILIDRLLGRAAVADYAPGVQVDSALLLIVAAVASVLLPRTALAHARGDPRTSFKYYIRGTLATGVLLALAAGIAIAVAPLGFRLWLGDSMPVTVTLLPLMLINTVIGGSGAVGRSVLLAIGKVRAFTASVLCAGAVNIIAAYLLVKYGHMGLRGIVLGTIIAVVGRCVLWMPWYVWRVLGVPGRL
jgi:O-antigen/teichoic acid export membrane protein